MAKLEMFVSSPGTGKTTACIDTFREAILRSKSGIDNHSYFVLPSREHADRIQHLVLKKDIPGLFNAHIISINDLAPRLFGSVGVMRPTDAIRGAVIRRILSGQTHSGAHFPYFDAVKDLRGFHDLLIDLVKEFTSSLLSIDAFEERSQALLGDGGFKAKFRDFSILLKNYEIEIKALGLQEAETSIDLMQSQALLAQKPDLVILDGFYHFNRSQQALLEVATSIASQVIVTLTLPDRGADSMLFEYPERTRLFLRRLGFQEIKAPFSRCYRTDNPELLHLQKQLFSLTPDVYPNPAISLEILEAPSVRTEIEMIARKIRQLYREQPYHYSDICVIFRTIGRYEKIVRSVFREYQVPVYIHERFRLVENGFVAVLCSFLRLLIEDWPRDDVFYILKSSFFRHRVGLEEIILLEAEAFRDNIVSGRESWRALSEKGSHSAISLLLEEFAAHEARILSARSIRELGHAIDQLLKMFDFGEPGSDPESEEEDGYAMGCLKSILQGARRYQESAENQKFSALEFIPELLESIERGLFSMVPEDKNRVQVYDAVMAMPKEFKVVFIAGLLEKSFPKIINEDPLFKDRERRVINGTDPVLEERSWRGGGERYFFYMAVSRAKEKLFFTYPAYDAEGRGQLRSFYISEIERCFAPKAITYTKKRLDEFLPTLSEVESVADVERVRADLRRMAGAPPRLPLGYFTDPRILENIARMKRVYSATKLETFATCSFKYFADRLLRLKKPLEGREAMEMGTLLHNTLEDYYRGLTDEDKTRENYLAAPEVVRERLFSLLESKAEASIFKNELPYRRYAYLSQMKEALSKYVAQEIVLAKARDLVPTHFELGFGAESGSDYDYLTVPMNHGFIRLTGKMDRVDLSRDGKRALVIDYKRSEREVSIPKKLEKGLELQLPIYLIAVEKLLGLRAMGAELRILKDEKKEGLYLSEYAKDLKVSEAQGVSEEKFRGILNNAEKQIRSIVERIEKGEIAVNSKTCRFCDFDPVCRFEKWKLVYAKN